MSLQALIWDFDGTLVDTRRRNLSVTREIVERVAGREAAEFPALATVERYERLNRRVANWRELYREAFGFDEEEIDRAGELWAEHQLRSPVPTPLFEGVAEAVAGVPDVPQGVVSLNARENIEKVLDGEGLRDRFRTIVGYEEVPLRRQKPAPDGLLRCLETLGATGTGSVLYVGDHLTDVRCAAAANRRLREDGSSIRVVAVAAGYGPTSEPAGWSPAPDHVARRPVDVTELARRMTSGGPR